MKLKKLASLALAGALTLGLLPTLAAPALATGGDSTYTLTIPSTLTVANSGWNATAGISATGTLESGKKLTVTAESTNGWKLVSGSNNVGYTLTTASGGNQTTSWEFTTLDGTAKPMGIIVDDYSTKPAGTYQDTVTFTAKVENAVTTRTVTFNTATDGKTINKDGVTCGDSFDNYNNLFCFRSGFSVSSGQFTKIEVTASDTSMTGQNQSTMANIEGWSGGTWTGKSSTVPFGVIMGNSNPVTIVFTIEE